METKEEDEAREAEVRPEDDDTEEARREVLKSPRILLAIQMTPSDDDDIVTRAVKVTDSTAMAVIPFLQSS